MLSASCPLLASVRFHAPILKDAIENQSVGVVIINYQTPGDLRNSKASNAGRIERVVSAAGWKGMAT